MAPREPVGTMKASRRSIGQANHHCQWKRNRKPEFENRAKSLPRSQSKPNPLEKKRFLTSRGANPTKRSRRKALVGHKFFGRAISAQLNGKRSARSWEAPELNHSGSNKE